MTIADKAKIAKIRNKLISAVKGNGCLTSTVLKQIKKLDELVKK